MARALSLREAQSILLSVNPHELLPSALGLVLAAFAPLPFVRLAGRTRAARVATAALAAVATGLLVARVHGWIASGQLPGGVRTALARVAAETAPRQVICAPEGVRDWVPALAGRPAGEPGPWVPAVYAEEWARRPRRACVARVETFVSQTTQPLTPQGETDDRTERIN
jgi:hypothetical protein